MIVVIGTTKLEHTMKTIRHIIVAILYLGFPFVVLADWLIYTGKGERKSIRELSRMLVDELCEIRDGVND